MAKKSNDLLSDALIAGEEHHGDETSTKYRCNRPKRKVNNVLSYNDRDFHSPPKASINNVQVEDHFEDMFKELHALQRSNIYCNVMLKTKEGHVPAHSVVLMAASPALFQDVENADSSTAADTRCIDLSHVPHWIVEDVVSFIYSGKLQLLKSRVKEFAVFCKSIGLLKLCNKLNAKSPVLSQNCGKDSSAKIPKDGFVDSTANCKESLVVQNGKNISSKKIKDSDEKKKDRCKETHTIKKPKRHKGRIKKDLHEANEEKAHGESFADDLQIKENHSPGRDLSCSKQLYSCEEQSLLSDNESQVEKTHVKEKEAINDHNNADGNGDLTDSQKVVHKPCQVESQANKTSQIKAGETDDSYLMEVSTHSDSDATDIDMEFRSLLKKAKHSVLKADEDQLLKNSTTETTKIQVIHCKRCKEDFETQGALKRHRKTCKGNRPRKRCILCQVSFATAEEYLHHRKTDKKCLDIQRQKHQRRLHRKAQLRARFSCRVCPRKFRRVADHIDHEFVSHELPYDKEQWPDLYCEYCNYWTMNPWRLHHHKTYDCSKGQEYMCDVCGNKYKNEKTLRCHKEMQHTDALPMLTCEQCGKTLKGKKGLLHHVRIMHKGENPHKRHMCHICSMKYTSVGDLSFHLHRVHDQPLPDNFIVYHCEECDYVINNKRTYEKHKLLHRDTRDFHCELCPKAFKTKNSLHTHMKSHNGKKMPCPYDGCIYSALKKCHLKTHIQNQHTQKGVKNEECHMCSYSTFFKGNLIKHLRTVHQLEVVTRYSVQMKAKYKHLKTGDILGKMDNPSDPNPPKVLKKSDQNDASNNDNATKTKPNKPLKDEVMQDQFGNGHRQIGTSSEELVKHTEETVHEASAERYQHLAEGIAQGQMDSHTILHNMGTHMAGPSVSNPYVYAVNSMHTSNNPNGANNMSFMYGTPQDHPGAPGNTMAMTISPSAGPVREVNLAMPSVYVNKVPAGVATPVVFQTHDTGDEVNSAKMLTYLQI